MKAGIKELIFAGNFGLIGLLGFANMQTRQPYNLAQIRFCPQSANHPNVLNDNIAALNESRSKLPDKNLFGNKKKPFNKASIKDFDTEAQKAIDTKYCHKPRYILAEEWERYGKFGSTIPYKGIAISLVKDLPTNGNYIWFNFGAVGSLWGITSCILIRISRLKREDFESSEYEKTELYKVWLEKQQIRTMEHFKKELDTDIAKEYKNAKHQEMREKLGIADTDNEAYRNRLQVETVLLSREAQHASLKKEIAEKNLDTAKAIAETNRVNNGIEILEKKIHQDTLSNQGKNIVDAIATFGLELEYIGSFTAPAVIRHRFKFSPGSKNKITDFQKLADDLALQLALKDTPRIVRDKGEIIVEVPRDDREFPHINDAIKILRKPEGDSVIIIGGIDFNGDLMHLNLLESPDCHGMGAGATKSGKTQGIYAQIASLISMYPPDEIKLAIYDGKSSLILPKELNAWLFCETAIAGQGGEYIELIEQERKKRIAIREGYRDIAEFNKDNPSERLPYIIVLMDEYSVDREAFEGEKNNPDSNKMKQLAKLARSEGIHLLPFDQSAKDENISNRVKENLGFRIIYRMVDQKSSSYLEVDGAHQLLGKGDVIIKWEGRQYRCQMPNCSPDDLKAIASNRLQNLDSKCTNTTMLKLQTEKGAEWDWYDALNNWALDADPAPTRKQIQIEWLRLTGSEPNKEQLDIFIENLEALS